MITYRTIAGSDTAALARDDETVYDRIRYLCASEITKESHVLALDGDRIIGIAGMQVNPYDEEQLWIKFISVDDAYRERGIGKALLRGLYEYASAKGHRMAPGSFTEQGERLRHLHDVLDAEFPTVAYERDLRGNYIRGGKIIRSAD